MPLVVRAVVPILAVLPVAVWGQIPEARRARSVKIEVASSASLARAKAFLAAGQWEEAVDTLQRVAEGEGTALMQLDGPAGDRTDGFARYVPAGRYCQLLLAGSGQQASEPLRLYRRRVDPVARSWYERAVADRDTALLERIADRLFLSSYGDDALLQLGDLALERGQYAQARRWWEQISPLLRAPGAGGPLDGSRPLWLALQDIDLERQWDLVAGWLTGARSDSGWLAYPDTDLSLAAVRSRLVLASILEQSYERASLELEVLRRLHPEAEGQLAGRRGRYVDLLDRLLKESRTWPPQATDPDWMTFAGRPSRQRIARPAVDPDLVPLWSVPLPVVRADNDVVGMGRPRIAEAAEGLLSYHPLVVGQLVLWNDAYTIHVHPLQSSDPVWGTIDERHRWQIDLPVDLPSRPAVARPTLFRAPRSHIGVPRFTMTASGQRLFARLGDPVTSSRQEDAERSKAPRGMLVGLDLSRQGSLLPGFPLSPDGLRWEFEGAPVTDGARLFVAMRHSAANGAMPEIHVACYELATVKGQPLRLRWRTQICSAETPAGGRFDEITHLLLTLHEDTIYCNTNLGAVAALSAASGRIRWVVRYPRVPLRPEDPNQNDWCYFRDLNPCLCYKDFVFAAPADHPSILALDSSTGQLLWATRLPDVVHLLGVAEGHLIASGLRLYWIDIRTGRVAAQVPRPGGPLADGLARPEPSGYGRGVLAGPWIYWPTRRQLLVFRQQLAERAAPGGGHLAAPELVRVLELARPDLRLTGGNLVVAGGLLLVAGPDRLYALGGRSVTEDNLSGAGGTAWLPAGPGESAEHRSSFGRSRASRIAEGPLE